MSNLRGENKKSIRTATLFRRWKSFCWRSLRRELTRRCCLQETGSRAVREAGESR